MSSKAPSATLLFIIPPLMLYGVMLCRSKVHARPMLIVSFRLQTAVTTILYTRVCTLMNTKIGYLSGFGAIHSLIHS